MLTNDNIHLKENNSNACNSQRKIFSLELSGPSFAALCNVSFIGIHAEQAHFSLVIFLILPTEREVRLVLHHIHFMDGAQNSLEIVSFPQFRLPKVPNRQAK